MASLSTSNSEMKRFLRVTLGLALLFAVCSFTYDGVVLWLMRRSPSCNAVKIERAVKGGQGERVYSTKGIAATLSAYGGGVFSKTGGYWVNGKARRLSPRECARLMGYPDTYLMADNKNEAYKQFGNSVVVDVLQYIVEEICKVI